uniref:C2H2-type domain-containing protein n=1 Tax=Chrysemys picta bellii TaxID=8478 RepID=A0A8C3FEX1_CHRPI
MARTKQDIGLARLVQGPSNILSSPIMARTRMGDRIGEWGLAVRVGRLGARTPGFYPHFQFKSQGINLPGSCPGSPSCLSPAAAGAAAAPTPSCKPAGRSYQCPECRKSFQQTSHLLQHQTTHTGEGPYRCPDCGRAFSQSSDLVRHQRATHSGERPFGCADCGKRFGHSSSLHKHRRVHTAQRPFGCADCGERFLRSADLLKHRLSPSPCSPLTPSP